MPLVCTALIVLQTGFQALPTGQVDRTASLLETTFCPSHILVTKMHADKLDKGYWSRKLQALFRVWPAAAR